jgi:uncharacterized protein
MKSPTMAITIFLSVALIVLVMLYLWYVFFFHRVNPPLPQNTVTVGDNVFEVEIASTTTEQALGLSGRSGLGDNQGMFFAFNSPGVQNFWMKDMKFSIDIIWIAGNKVAGFAQNAAPQPGVPLWNLKIFTSPNGVDKVLEVNAGTVAKDGIQIGDTVLINK